MKSEYTDTRIANILKWFVKTNRKYRDYEIRWYAVQKVFNGGKMCRDLCRIDDYKNEILVAKDFANKSDYKRINDLCAILTAKLGKDYKIVDVSVRDNQMRILYT